MLISSVGFVTNIRTRRRGRCKLCTVCNRALLHAVLLQNWPQIRHSRICSSGLQFLWNIQHVKDGVSERIKHAILRSMMQDSIDQSSSLPLLILCPGQRPFKH